MTKGRDFFQQCYGIIYILIIFNIFIAVESKSLSNRTETSPTVYPADPFDPVADAETLHKAMKGFGADAKAIVEVLTKRDMKQRLEIARIYKTYYGKDLKDELKNELSERVRSVIIGLMTELPEHYSEQIRNAVAGLGTDEEVIIEILCTLSNDVVRNISQHYERMYGKTLEHDLKEDTSGDFQRLVVSLLQANREENPIVNELKSEADAVELLNAETYAEKFTQLNKILVRSSYQQLRATFALYERYAAQDIEEEIENEFSGPVKMGFLSIVKCVKSKPDYFAERLHAAMDGMTTNHSTLIRIIALRSEIDLGDIKQAFLAKYGKTLESRITDCTSGNYKKALLSLLGN